MIKYDQKGIAEGFIGYLTDVTENANKILHTKTVKHEWANDLKVLAESHKEILGHDIGDKLNG